MNNLLDPFHADHARVFNPVVHQFLFVIDHAIIKIDCHNMEIRISEKAASGALPSPSQVLRDVNSPNSDLLESKFTNDKRPLFWRGLNYLHLFDFLLFDLIWLITHPNHFS